MVVINMFGGPGTGKSTNSAYIFAKLKEAGINCEYIQEFAKDKTWEENGLALQCQPYVTAKQFWRQFRVKDKVQVIVTDSPIITGLLYQGFGCSPAWQAGVLHQFSLFHNLNIFLVRNPEKHPYNPKGRRQTEEQSKEIDGQTKLLLEMHGLPFHEIVVDDLEKTWGKIRRLLVIAGVDLPEPPAKAWMI